MGWSERMKDKEFEQLVHMYTIHDHKCFVTGNQATQRAHIIGNTLLNRKLYGKRIIDDPLNWLPCDSLKSNALIDIGRNERLTKWIVSVIDSMDDIQDKRELIEDIVRENIERKQCKINQ